MAANEESVRIAHWISAPAAVLGEKDEVTKTWLPAIWEPTPEFPIRAFFKYAVVACMN